MRPSFNPVQNVEVEKDKRVSLASLFDNVDFLFVWKIIMRKYSLHGKNCDPVAVFKALLLKEIRQISSRRELSGFLDKSRFWLRKCGFDSPPHHDTFSKFIDRVGVDSFEQIFDCLVRKIGEMKDIGRIIAVDSTLIEAYANPHNGGGHSDPDAVWGFSTTKEWVFGYKVHIVADANLELPIAFTVTPANIYDGTEYPNLLKNLIEKGIKPKIVLADAGYDSKKNYFITLAEDAIPIIALNPRNMKKKKRDFERASPIQRDSEAWRSLYKKRGSVERVISRLKEGLNLKTVKVRSIDKVKIHVALNLIAMLTVALAALKTGNGKMLKSINSFKF